MVSSGREEEALEVQRFCNFICVIQFGSTGTPELSEKVMPNNAWRNNPCFRHSGVCFSACALWPSALLDNVRQHKFTSVMTQSISSFSHAPFKHLSLARLTQHFLPFSLFTFTFPNVPFGVCLGGGIIHIWQCISALLETLCAKAAGIYSNRGSCSHTEAFLTHSYRKHG